MVASSAIRKGTHVPRKDELRSRKEFSEAISIKFGNN